MFVHRAAVKPVYTPIVALKSTRTLPDSASEPDLALAVAGRRGDGRRLAVGVGAEADAPDAADAKAVRLEQRVAQLEEELAHERRIGVALREVGLALGTTLELDSLLELILAKIVDVIDADRATLYLLDEDQRQLVSRIVQGGEVRAIRLAVGQGIAGYVAQTGKSLLVNKPYEDARFRPEWDQSSGYRTESVLAVPIKNHRGRIIGVVQVLNKREGTFTDHDAVVLTSIATQAAVSIDNFRLFLSVTQKNAELLDAHEQLERRVRDLKLLFDLESAMGRAATVEALVSGVVVEALRISGATLGAFALRQSDSEVAQVHVMQAGDSATRVLPSIRPTQGFIGAAMADAEVVMTNHASLHSAYDSAVESLLGQPCRSCLCVPIDGEDAAPIGAIALYNKASSSGEPAAFDDDDRALMLLIAANASTAVQLHLSRDAREREERLTTIGRLLSGVIHDLRTPLGVISGYVQLMQSADSRDLRDEYAELVHKQFDHIGAMQRDVLEFARGEKNVWIRKVYLAKFFDEVREQLQTPLARVGVELVIDLVDKGVARFDEGKILRVIQNLARNAAEAMAGNRGTFTIRVTREKPKNARGEEALVLTFSDTGPGIPKEIEHRVFQSFVTSGKKGGTGLGLAITKRIAEEHGGSVSVQSSSRGATFKLRLPQPQGET